MPLFDYKCLGCGEQTKNVLLRNSTPHVETCPKCGGKMTKQFGVFRPRVFQPYWEDNLGPSPVFIDSRATLQREAKKRQLSPAGG